MKIYTLIAILLMGCVAASAAPCGADAARSEALAALTEDAEIYNTSVLEYKDVVVIERMVSFGEKRVVRFTCDEKLLKEKIRVYYPGQFVRFFRILIAEKIKRVKYQAPDLYSMKPSEEKVYSAHPFRGKIYVLALVKRSAPVAGSQPGLYLVADQLVQEKLFGKKVIIRYVLPRVFREDKPWNAILRDPDTLSVFMRFKDCEELWTLKPDREFIRKNIQKTGSPDRLLEWRKGDPANGTPDIEAHKAWCFEAGEQPPRAVDMDYGPPMGGLPRTLQRRLGELREAAHITFYNALRSLRS